MSNISPEHLAAEEFFVSDRHDPTARREHMNHVQHDRSHGDHVAHVQNRHISYDEQLSYVQHELSNRGESIKRAQVRAQNIGEEHNLVAEDHDQRDEQSSSSNQVIPMFQGQNMKKKRVQASVSNQSEEVFLYPVGTCSRPIARGVIVNKDSKTIVGGGSLGKQFWEVFIEVVMQPNETLIRPYENMKTIGDAALKSSLAVTACKTSQLIRNAMVRE